MMLPESSITVFYYSVVEAMQALGCQQSRLDPSLYHLRENGQLIGFMASHIDDFLHAGEASFDDKVMARLTSRFMAGKLEVGSFGYVGFTIIQNEQGIVDGSIRVSGNFEDIVIPPVKASQKHRPLVPSEQTQLRQIAGRLNWIVQVVDQILHLKLWTLVPSFRLESYVTWQEQWQWYISCKGKLRLWYFHVSVILPSGS